VAAMRRGAFAGEIVPVPVARVTYKGAKKSTGMTQFAVDELPRAETTREGLGKLKPAFAATGVVTAGNSSPLSDGAAALPVPEGVAIRPFRVDVDEHVMHGTMNEAFEDHFRQSEEPFDAWKARLLGHADFDPDLWFLAWDGDEAAGARAYLATRAIEDATRDEFQLGYAPARGEAIRESLKALGIADEVQQAAGLLVAREEGTLVPRFRGRLIFPIADVRGRVVGFGGRILGDGEPKYLNSPETPVFHKGSLLYGLDRARGAIRTASLAVIVEGYVDAIRCHVAGVANVVAPLGTALTPEQAKVLRRYTKQDVSLEDEQKLIDAAFAAPSGNNARPWHFVFVRDPRTRARLKGMHQWTWMLDKAPLVVAVLGTDEDDPWWIEDCAAATENILLEATSLGLGSVWCGMREDATEVVGCEKACCQVLGIPVGKWRVLALIGIGHPGEKKQPRTQRQVSKVSYERFGRRTRSGGDSRP